MKMTRRTFAALSAAALAAASVAGFARAEEAAEEETAIEMGIEEGEGETRIFVDGVGRRVEVPAKFDKIAPSGHTAQQVLLAMAPELMVGLSSELGDEQKKYFSGTGLDFDEMPIFGAAFGAKGDMNKEAVAAAGAQIVIDTGEPKDGILEDLDTIQAQLGIPVVFINTPLKGWGDAFRALGELLCLEERGEELAAWCDNAWEETQQVMESIPEDERVNCAYLLGAEGLNAIAHTSYQATVVDMCTNNVVVLEKASGSGNGNEISLEQIAVWDPEMIIFGAGSVYDTVADDPVWSSLTAVANGNYYEVPSEPWCWLNNPPTVNQVMGLQWLPRLCYPAAYEGLEDAMTLEEVVKGYYGLFYGYEFEEGEYEELVAKALPATA